MTQLAEDALHRVLEWMELQQPWYDRLYGQLGMALGLRPVLAWVAEQRRQYIVNMRKALYYLERRIVMSLPLAHRVSLLPGCLLYTSPSPRDGLLSRMPSSA